MLNISFVGSAKFELKDLAVCIAAKWREISRSYHDLHLDPTMSNIKLVQAIIMYYNVFKHGLLFELLFKSHTHTHTYTHTHTHTHSDSDE